jgi:sterol desaturase/sphingolipid hydroxylase (fatty acid hydroxylase superfamily)
MLILIIPLLLLNLNSIFSVYDTLSLDYSDKTLFIWGTTIGSFFIYWTIGSIYLLFDQYPEYFSRFKIQSIYNKPDKLYNIFKVVSFNQLIVTPIFGYISYNYMEPSNIKPTLFLVIKELSVSLIATEIFFYYSHRLLHLPYLYRKIHSLHHSYKTPMGITSLYSHPIEYIISNILPVIIGSILCSSHITTIWIWQIIVLTNTIKSHSGYNFINLKIFTNNSHDIHHMKYKYNYGVLNILDYLHGTNWTG